MFILEIMLIWKSREEGSTFLMMEENILEILLMDRFKEKEYFLINRVMYKLKANGVMANYVIYL